MQCASERIETVRRVYQKNVQEEEKTKDRQFRKNTSVLKTDDRMTIHSTPGRSMTPQNLSKVIKGNNRQHAIDNANICQDLVKPAHNFDVNAHDAFTPTMDVSHLHNDELIRKDGQSYIKRRVVTIVKKTITEELIVVPNATTQNSLDDTTPMDITPISCGKFQMSRSIFHCNL